MLLYHTHQEFDSPEELKDTIRCFWYERRDYPDEATSYEILPDGYTEIIFYFGDLSNINDQGQLEQLPSPFIMGLLNQPVYQSAKNRIDILGIRCYPWTVFDMLGVPSINNGIQLISHPIETLQAQLQQLISNEQPEAAITLLQQYFLEHMSQLAIDMTLFKAGAAMRSGKGTLAVSEVAAAAHASVRTVERKFKQSSGRTIKDVSGLMRFEQVRNHLWHFPDANLAGLAIELGYTDQAHLSREFRRYSGTTPAAFARRHKKQQNP
ncbi:helix-turn-helix domain-containing protein [Chitinophaga sp. Cy-1792]|uniref:AraC family transcriptional regulator n=1 Tax=Chitinophaga sp. Cy-1792 TaxID=2608339 RepID=UPI001963275F|nr:helix-turn-helix domain-containing protein [Chitinophaga sp. Cy-1792]